MSAHTLAAYFVAFGPHGPRAPVTVPGQQGKVLVGTLLSCLAAFGIFTYARSKGKSAPRVPRSGATTLFWYCH